MDPIVSIDAIDKLAKQAAAQYTTVNDACPYPFGTHAATVFCKKFNEYLAEAHPKCAALSHDPYGESECPFSLPISSQIKSTEVPA